jgi:hypothetical protein
MNKVQVENVGEESVFVNTGYLSTIYSGSGISKVFSVTFPDFPSLHFGFDVAKVVRV